MSVGSRHNERQSSRIAPMDVSGDLVILTAVLVHRSADGVLL